MRSRLDVDGGRPNSYLLVVVVHPLEYVPLGAGVPFRDEVVSIQVRERLKHSHRIELPITEHRLDRDAFCL